MFFLWIVPWILYLRRHHHTESHLFFFLFYLLGFIVLHVAFRSVIHFELAFMGGLCADSCFEWTWINTQLFQHHLLGRVALLFCITFAPLSNISQLYLWGCISGLSTFSHRFIPHFHQYHTRLVTVVLIVSLEAG